MAVTYSKITTKELLETLPADASVIIITNGAVKRINAYDLMADNILIDEDGKFYVNTEDEEE